MTDKLSIMVILGSNRPVRRSEFPAKFIFKKLKGRKNVEPIFVDVRDFDLPPNEYGDPLKEKFPEFSANVVKADGFVFVVPEYNHGYPGHFKSVIDIHLKEYIHKPVGLAGVSKGPWGGTRVIEAMTPMVRELGLAVTFTDMDFANAGNVFDEQGNLVDDNFNRRVDGFLDELLWMTTTLKWGRENVPSKHHQK